MMQRAADTVIEGRTCLTKGMGGNASTTDMVMRS